MLSKTDAVVLRSLRLKDNRMIVDMFTSEHGRVSFVVALPRSRRGGVARNYFEPLNCLSVECDMRPQSELQKLREAAILLPLPGLHGDLSKTAMVLFMAEFLCHALRDESCNRPLFAYLVSSLEWLDAASGDFANFHLVFLMRLTRFLGFYPNLEAYADGDFFDLRDSVFCSRPPLHGDYLQPAEASHISTLMRMDYVSMHLFRMSRDERRRIVEVLLAYYRLHLPALPALRSLPVLQELFD